MIAGSTNSELFKKTLIGKLPNYVWWIILYVLSVGANYFVNQSAINMIAIQFTALGNTLWMHFIMGIMNVLIFELVAYLYGSIATGTFGRGGFNFTRKDFSNTFRAFYCLSLIATGALQTLYYFYPISIVWGTTFFGSLPRIACVFLFFMYMKKTYFNEYNTHIGVKAIFIPYFIYEAISILLVFI